MLILKPYFDPQTGAAGGGAAPNATPAVDEKETQEYQTLVSKKDTELNDQEKTRLNELKGKYDVKLVGEDGKELTPDQVQELKNAEKKFNEILAKPEAQRTKEENEFLEKHQDPGEQKSVYEQVDEATGIEYKLDYGDVDPNSVDGIVMREEAIRKQAITDFERNIKSKFPQAHQFMLHLSQGGKVDDFFKPENQDFLQLTVKKEDPAGQERVLRTALLAKGVSPAIIETMITAVKDGGQMFELSKTELEALQTLQKQKEQKREQAELLKRQKEDQDVDALGDQLEEALEKGFDGIKIPNPVERQKFAKYLYDRIDYNNGSFFLTKSLDTKNIAKELKYAWFEFKGGDINELAARTAKSQIAKKFKSSYKQEFIPKGATPSATKLTPLGEM